MQPAFFDNGQILATTYYHVDACLWKENTFIDGATFFMPSKLPEVGSDKYSIDLDSSTGVYHVSCRTIHLRTSLSLTKTSKPDFSSHVVEFSKGKMTTVPRIDYANTIFKREEPKCPSRENEQHNAITKIEAFHQQYIKKRPKIAIPSISAITDTDTKMENSPPAGSDTSVTEYGPIVGHQAPTSQSTLSTLSESIIHMMPWETTKSASIEAADVAQAQWQHVMMVTISSDTTDTSSTSRRSRSVSPTDESPPSTVPTSPASSIFFEIPSSTVANIQQVLNVPGECTPMIKALALERPRSDGLEASKDTDEKTASLRHRLSLDLRISVRQLIHWDKIQDGESPRWHSKKGIRIPRSNDLTIDENGQIIMIDDIKRDFDTRFDALDLS